METKRYFVAINFESMKPTITDEVNDLNDARTLAAIREKNDPKHKYIVLEMVVSE